MRTGIVLFFLGSLSVLQLNELPPVYICYILLLFLICLRKFSLCNYCLWFASGFTWALWYSSGLLSHSLEPSLEGRDVMVSGYVDSLPDLTERYQRFRFSVVELTDGKDGRTLTGPGKVRLYWYMPSPYVQPGDYLRLIVRLKRPHGLKNPGTFDYEAWLFREKIRATGYVRKLEASSTGEDRRLTIHRLRFHIGKKLDEIIPGSSPLTSLVHALILGNRSKIDSHQREVLMNTGTSHLLAISGLHIGLVAGFGFFIIRWLWPLSAGLTNLVPAQYAASVFSMTLALYYALLAGFSVPTQRALIMLVLVLSCFIAGRKLGSSSILAIALVLVLLADPLAPLSAGFWLSFLAVMIILFTVNRETVPARFSRPGVWFRIQISIYLGLVPVIILVFNQVPLVSLVANMVAIPWVSFITMPLLLSGTLSIFIHSDAASVLFVLGVLSLHAIWQYLELLAGFDGFVWTLPDPSGTALIASISGIGLLLMPKGFPCRPVAILFLLPLFLPNVSGPEYGDFDITVLDVGQGLAVVARTEKRLLLYDTGIGSSAGYNSGSSVIVPYLKHSGLRTIDTIVQSHGDNDHIGGLNHILELMPVHTMFTSVPEQTRFESAKPCLAGQYWVWDGVRFEILHPSDTVEFNGNNASCVLKIGTGRSSVLLTGDIESRAEARILDKIPAKLPSMVMVAPHHGSKTSSGHRFIHAVSPETVIFSSGYLNRFRLPNQDIIDRYRTSGAETFNTATDGAVTIRFRNGKISVSGERERASRFWNFKA